MQQKKKEKHKIVLARLKSKYRIMLFQVADIAIMIQRMKTLSLYNMDFFPDSLNLAENQKEGRQTLNFFWELSLKEA